MGLNVFALFASVAVWAAVLILFRRYAFRRGSATYHLGAAVFWVSVNVIGRAIWWDGLKGMGLGIEYNAIWNVLATYAGGHVLIAAYLLDRPKYQSWVRRLRFWKEEK